MTQTSTTYSLIPTVAIVNARVWTGDTRRPWADAVAVTGDRITAVGSSAEVRKLARPVTRVIDAQGKMLVPGFIDAHVHFVEGVFAAIGSTRAARKAGTEAPSTHPMTMTSRLAA